MRIKREITKHGVDSESVQTRGVTKHMSVSFLALMMLYAILTLGQAD